MVADKRKLWNHSAFIWWRPTYLHVIDFDSCQGVLELGVSTVSGVSQFRDKKLLRLITHILRRYMGFTPRLNLSSNSLQHTEGLSLSALVLQSSYKVELQGVAAGNFLRVRL